MTNIFGQIQTAFATIIIVRKFFFLNFVFQNCFIYAIQYNIFNKNLILNLLDADNW
jgi:hypothetical protein